MPWNSVSGLSGMYHGMIAPLAGVPLRGALWYQGESNPGDPETYENFLRLLMADFRARFGPGLPMLVIKLPEFGPRMMMPGDSGWSSLRDAQRRFVMADEATGFVVALGAGDEWDIHPPNKQEVARRMRMVRDALLDRPAYPARGGYSPLEVKRAGDVIRIAPPETSGAYKTSGHHQPVGFMLCGTGGDCAFTDARLSGHTIEIDALPIETALVRYCRGDTPVCNLSAPDGAPVTAFKLPLN